jgi:aminoglycoside 2''-phosphotransferase
MDCQEAQFLGSGWATDVYLVDGRYAVRFPRNAELASYLDQDVAVLQLVASELRNSFAVPSVLYRGKAGPHFPYDFLVCEFVNGISADDPKAPHPDELTCDIGEALTRIHSVPVALARQAGLTEPLWDDYKGTPSFLHLDFRGNNILVDANSGRLAGVIDWGNAAVGDPALDFMWLVVWRGWPFARAVLENYAKPVDATFAERIKQKAAIQGGAF